jgi:hypothetical protein
MGCTLNNATNTPLSTEPAPNHGDAETPYSATLPDPRIEQSASTPETLLTRISAEARTITLFSNYVAGDYDIFQIDGNGYVEQTGWNRLNQVLEYKQAEISQAEIDGLFRTIEANGFYKLDEKYDIYPLPADNTVVYEDQYYILKVVDAGIEKIVLAHDQAMPENLKVVIGHLLGLFQEIPASSANGDFILAGDHDILGYKRFVSDAVTIQITSGDFAGFSTIREAIEDPYKLIPFSDMQLIPSELNQSQTSIVVIYNDQYYEVLWLHSE